MSKTCACTQLHRHDATTPTRLSPLSLTPYLHSALRCANQPERAEALLDRMLAGAYSSSSSSSGVSPAAVAPGSSQAVAGAMLVDGESARQALFAFLEQRDVAGMWRVLQKLVAPEVLQLHGDGLSHTIQVR